ncbi:hypothetical protein SAMN05421676_105233 [Salinibacillus kushneri]|uniref:Uncharacterized protein n=1 Tax=Salinibacillus kushneri TaxID=237682 RepID=A0A1I0F837_9BACI|nr:hypothetical protein [Salinibacillus kushneri]SET54029.1 hypothetical protein SAMN05421676_105233 [Salinibacillus kushneri]
MVDALLDFMLGPLRAITDFYVEHQFILSSIIVGFAVYKIYFSKRKQTQNDSVD